MRRPVGVLPQHQIRLADLVVYVLTFKATKPELAERAKLAIREGHYYERN